MSTISGNLEESARIIIINEEDWTIEDNSIHSAGGFNITTTSGLKMVIGRINSGEAIGYGNVEAYEEA